MLMAACKIQLVVTCLSVCDTPSKAQPAACKNLKLGGGGNGETFKKRLNSGLGGQVRCEHSALAGCLISPGSEP